MNVKLTLKVTLMSILLGISFTTVSSSGDRVTDIPDQEAAGNYYSTGISDINPINGQEVFRHVTVHVAPTESAPPRRPKLPPKILAPEKHYQIIFVKAPAPPKPPQTVVRVAPPPKQKTLVYVLVKRPEDQNGVKLIAPLPTQPSKPDVFFIKYKNRHDSHNSEQNLVQAQQYQDDGTYNQITSYDNA